MKLVANVVILFGNSHQISSRIFLYILKQVHSRQSTVANVADCRLPIADCRLPTADCRLPTADCRLPTAD
ncbi:MAG: hypothetical protein FVQ77_09905 [Cytophagales bacterium]|nr:hypothetical protein [Cytophagales bacterium]